MYLTGTSVRHIDKDGVFRYAYCSGWDETTPTGVPGGLDEWEVHAKNPNNNAFENAMYFIYEPLVKNTGIEKLIIAGESKDLAGNHFDAFSRLLNGLEGGKEFYEMATGKMLTERIKNKIVDKANKEIYKNIVD